MTRTESAEQQTIFEWSRLNYGKYPELEHLFFAVPNGGSRHKLEAYSLKRQGVKSGISDMTIQVARGGYHGLWIELKVGKNRASENQEKFINEIKKQGYYAEVIWGAENAIDLIKKYLEGKLKKNSCTSLTSCI
jgi:uncharacterized protein YcgL (UPF0745 family)